MEGRGLRQKRGRQNWVDEEELESSSAEFTDADAEPDYSDDEDSRRGRLAVRWEGQIEARFIKALQQAGGVWEAKPKAILQKMGAYASQLTTIQVKSHLQKHRIKVAAEMQRTGATLATPPGVDAPAPLAAARAAAAAQAAAAAARQAAAAAAAVAQHKPRQPKAAAAAAAGSSAKAAPRGTAAASAGGRARKHQKQAAAAAQQQPAQQQAAARRQQPQHAPSTPQRVRFEAAPQYHQQQYQQQAAAAHEAGHPHQAQLEQQHARVKTEAQVQPQVQAGAATHARHYAHTHHSHPHAAAAYPVRQQLPLRGSHGHGQHLAAPAGALLLDPSYPAPPQESPPAAASGSSSGGGVMDAWEAGLLSVSVSGAPPPRYSSYGSAAHQQHAAEGMASPVRHGSLMRSAPTPLAPQGTAPAAFWAGTGLGGDGWPGLAAGPPQHMPPPAAHPVHVHGHATAGAMAAAAANPAADPAAPGLLAGSPLLAGPGGAPHTSDSDSDHFHADPDIAELLDMPLPEAMLRPGGAADPLFGYGLDARHASWALDSSIF